MEKFCKLEKRMCLGFRQRTENLYGTGTTKVTHTCAYSAHRVEMIVPGSPLDAQAKLVIAPHDCPAPDRAITMEIG